MNQTFRTLLIGLGLGLLATLLLLHAQETTLAAKFQIISGSRTISSMKTGQAIQEPTVFKMDTITGQTWVYEAYVDREGKPYRGWTPIQQ
jgi:hypothetical protein